LPEHWRLPVGRGAGGLVRRRGSRTRLAGACFGDLLLALRLFLSDRHADLCLVRAALRRSGDHGWPV
jgi:hypothetical protein